MRKVWRSLTFILPLVLASPLYAGDPPAPPDFAAIQQHSQITYKVVSIAADKSVEKPAPELSTRRHKYGHKLSSDSWLRRSQGM